MSALQHERVFLLPSIKSLMMEVDGVITPNGQARPQLPSLESAYHGGNKSKLGAFFSDGSETVSVKGAAQMVKTASCSPSSLVGRDVGQERLMSPKGDVEARPKQKSSLISASEDARVTDKDSVERRAALEKTIRVRWTPEEDELLLELITQHGPRHWKQLARHFPSREAPQLRSRWVHSLADTSSKRPFTEKEDEWILEGYARFGAKWKHIASFMEHRLPNDVHNRAKALLRKSKKQDAVP